MPTTLLLADDSVTIQRVIELTFADEHIQVIAVSNGDQAIAQLEAAPPDIVLADIGMPGKSGYEVAQYMRQSPRLAHIPLLLLAGAFEPVDQARAAAAGCDGVLAKPFEPQLVISRVRDLLSHPRSADPPAPGQPAAAGESALSLEVDPAVVPPPPRAALPEGELNDYFDRLDAAFATLSSGPARRREDIPAAPGTPDDDAIDWFGGPGAGGAGAEQWDLPAPSSLDVDDLTLGYLPPVAPVGAPVQAGSVRPAPKPVVEPVPVPRVGTVEPVPAAPPAGPSLVPRSAPGGPVALPPLADAFAALLAAEQGGIAPPITTWPAPPPLPPATVSDDVVEQITRRVLERLSDRVVADAVQAAVLPVAERLIREEIERIKSLIK